LEGRGSGEKKKFKKKFQARIKGKMKNPPARKSWWVFCFYEIWGKEQNMGRG